ncbi:hypothetical protein ACTMNS_03680, partial [Staphylococcus haemolyticus]
SHLLVQLYVNWVFNPKPNNLDRRFRIYRETLSRFFVRRFKYVLRQIMFELIVFDALSSNSHYL